MFHVVNRFVVAPVNNKSSSTRVSYRRFVDHYTHYVQGVDESGFVNLGQLTMNQPEAAPEAAPEEPDVEVLAGRLATMAERQMYVGGGGGRGCCVVVAVWWLLCGGCVVLCMLLCCSMYVVLCMLCHVSMTR